MKSAGSIQRTGEQSFKLVVCAGTGEDGRRIRKTKTVKVAGKTVEAQERNARRQLALFIAEVEQGKVSSGGSINLHNFYQYWKENYALRNHEKTTIAYNDFLFQRIDAALGHKKIKDITPQHILLFMKNLAEPGVKIDVNASRRKIPIAPENKTLSISSVRKHISLLNTLLAHAVRWNMLPYNPCTRIALPKAARKRPKIYDEATLRRFLELLAEEETKHQLLVSLALTGGLRRQEIFGLRWQDVNFQAHTVCICQASFYISGTLALKSPKSHSSNRTISLPDSCMALLKKHQEEQTERINRLGDKWVDTGLVFTKWNGTQAHLQTFINWLKRFTEAHNLPHITPHNFRHMNATYLIAAGTDVRTVAGKLGHAQTSTTVNIYAQLLQSAEQETAQTMESFLQDLRQKKDTP